MGMTMCGRPGCGTCDDVLEQDTFYSTRTEEEFDIIGDFDCRSSNELKMPRPLDSVVQMCGLHSVREVLQFGSLYHAPQKADPPSLAGELKEAGPEEHVGGLCAVLGVPYRLTHTVRQLLSAADMKHRLYGSRPHHIAGGALLAVGRQANLQGVWDNSLSLRDVSQTMDCRPNCIRRVVDRIPAFSLQPDSRPPAVVLSPWPGRGGDDGGENKVASDRQTGEGGTVESEGRGGEDKGLAAFRQLS
jgi:hypothetical protein